MSEQLPNGPLAGIRVFSFGQALAGGESTAILADLGAEVVKVESVARALAGRIVLWRDHPPVYEPSGVEVSSGSGSRGAGSLALSLDMGNPSGREVARRLISRADVLVENFAPGVMDKWGLSREEIEENYPQLISLSMPAFGSAGPYRHYVGFGACMAAYVGATALWGHGDGRHNDYISGYHGVFAVVAGLAYRKRTGKGIHIEMPQIEAGASQLGPFLLDAAINKQEFPQATSLLDGGEYLEVLPCSGPDTWVVIDVRDLEQWRAFSAVIERPDLLVDPRFVSADDREAHRDELRSIVAEWTQKLTPYQAMMRLQKAGVCAGAVQNGEDVYHDPQIWSRGQIIEVDHPDLGKFQYLQSPFKMTKTPGLYRGRVPRAGEHTRDVVMRWLELNDEEFGALEAKEAFA